MQALCNLRNVISVIFLTICILHSTQCGKINVRTTACNETYRNCSQNCRLDATQLLAPGDSNIPSRELSCLNECEQRFEGCLDRVETWTEENTN